MKFLQNKFSIFIILISITIFIYSEPIVSLIKDWYYDPNYSHGFLIPILAGYLIWNKREDLKNIMAQSSNWGIFIIIIGLFIYIFGTAAAEYFTIRISFLIVIVGIIIFCFGIPVMKKISFPIFMLIFMIPIPYIIYYALTFPLQIFSTKVATTILEWIGFSVLRKGNILYLQNNILEVAEACSGLRSLTALIALGAAMGYITLKSNITRFLLIISTIPNAIIANIFRLIIITLGSVLISVNFTQGILHEISGIIIFLIGFVLIGFNCFMLKLIWDKNNICRPK